MLCTFCAPTIWATSRGFCRNRPESSADKMYRACETKDQTLKKIRTLHFPDLGPSDPRSPKTPEQQKKKLQKPPKTPFFPKSKHSFPKSNRPLSGAKKDPQNQKIARTAPKNFLNNSRGLPVITQQNKGFEANRTRKFTRTFGKIFVTQFLCGTFLCPNFT